MESNNDVSTSWVTPLAINSNGAAYADLDNDGDLDLIVNNMEYPAGIYENKSDRSENRFIKFILEGPSSNPFAVGAKVIVKSQDNFQVQELHNARGYLSSVSHHLTFGCGTSDRVDNIKVIWDDKRVTELTDIETNQTLSIKYSESIASENVAMDHFKVPESAMIEVNTDDFNIGFVHKENPFDDYSKQLLLPQKQSTPGPCLITGDVNGDTLDDFYVGGAAGQSGQLYIQKPNNTFVKGSTSIFRIDADHEDAGAHFFDSDNDGDLDLYVASSGYELEEDSKLLQDRLYINDGLGNFSKSNKLPLMPSCTKAIGSIDFDNDGDLDLVVGGYVIPGKYPLAPQSYILENRQDEFVDVTEDIAPELQFIGMVSDIEISDIEQDDKLDMILVGHWMPITVFALDNGQFVKTTIPDFEKTEGWYNSISSSDLDNDGDIDLVFGNFGLNNKFHPTLDKPLHIFSSNFDDNSSYDIALSKYYKGELVPVRGKECSSEQTPFLNEKITTYKEFASLNMEGIYGNETIANSDHKMAYSFASVCYKNNGNGKYERHELPEIAQFSPTQDIEVSDVNNDGFADLIGVGNLYDAEVETIRYDASKGYVLLNNGKGEFVDSEVLSLYCDKDMRAISRITINGIAHYMVASNNDELTIYRRK